MIAWRFIPGGAGRKCPLLCFHVGGSGWSLRRYFTAQLRAGLLERKSESTMTRIGFSKVPLSVRTEGFNTPITPEDNVIPIADRPLPSRVWLSEVEIHHLQRTVVDEAFWRAEQINHLVPRHAGVESCGAVLGCLAATE